ncbi:MAG TPA: hydroxymyristoyl-ACP dehydratase [Flavobacteriaceae bacterium]|nr:hydroxymyristoyl-ACP dehydratase [Flavobacteriaceae bacterium]
MNFQEIISNLPFTEPFLFVDEIESVSDTEIWGNYTFPKNSFFYAGHFKNNPVTPGTILSECMAQIGLVSFGIHLLRDEFKTTENFQPKIALTSTEIEFYLPVYPNEKVRVFSKKVYFRFNKLKCAIKMYNQKGNLVSKGEISGMMKL